MDWTESELPWWQDAGKLVEVETDDGTITGKLVIVDQTKPHCLRSTWTALNTHSTAPGAGVLFEAQRWNSAEVKMCSILAVRWNEWLAAAHSMALRWPKGWQTRPAPNTEKATSLTAAQPRGPKEATPATPAAPSPASPGTRAVA